MERKYNWRCYLDGALRHHARIAALNHNIELRKYVSDVLREKLKNEPKEVTFS